MSADILDGTLDSCASVFINIAERYKGKLSADPTTTINFRQLQQTWERLGMEPRTLAETKEVMKSLGKAAFSRGRLNYDEFAHLILYMQNITDSPAGSEPRASDKKSAEEFEESAMSEEDGASAEKIANSSVARNQNFSSPASLVIPRNTHDLRITTVTFNVGSEEPFGVGTVHFDELEALIPKASLVSHFGLVVFCAQECTYRVGDGKLEAPSPNDDYDSDDAHAPKGSNASPTRGAHSHNFSV
eukprot:UC4_evm1s1494